MPQLLFIEPVIVSRLKEGDYIFRRDPGLNVVDIVEDIPTAGLEYLNVLSDVLSDLPKRSAHLRTSA